MSNLGTLVDVHRQLTSAERCIDIMLRYVTKIEQENAKLKQQAESKE